MVSAEKQFPSGPPTKLGQEILKKTAFICIYMITATLCSLFGSSASAQENNENLLQRQMFRKYAMAKLECGAIVLALDKNGDSALSAMIASEFIINASKTISLIDATSTGDKGALRETFSEIALLKSQTLRNRVSSGTETKEALEEKQHACVMSLLTD